MISITYSGEIINIHKRVEIQYKEEEKEINKKEKKNVYLSLKIPLPTSGGGPIHARVPIYAHPQFS